MRGLAAIFVAIVMVAMPFSVHALDSDPKQHWEEHADLIDRTREIDPLGTDLFGESVSYYSGGLSFSHTDVSVPGTSRLPVSISRSYTVSDARSKRNRDLPFADWDLNIPHIEGVYSKEYGWERQTLGHYGGPAAQRCSLENFEEVTPKGIFHSNQYFPYQDYWSGLQLSMGADSGFLLLDNADVSLPGRPQGDWYWRTASDTFIGCLSSVANADGEGFHALTSDGTRYYFNHMAAFYEPSLSVRNCNTEGICHQSTLERRRYRLYVTRIEDRFGNKVEFEYSNAANEPVKLDRIHSTETGGETREIELSYSDGRISYIEAHGRTWEYDYTTDGNGRASLKEVKRPDGRRWEVDFGELSAIRIKTEVPGNTGSDEDVARCLLPRTLEPASATGTITHPSGAVATFEVEPHVFSRTNVPKVCSGKEDPWRDPNIGDPVMPIHAYAPALMKKTIEGPALKPAVWTYSYVSDYGFEENCDSESFPSCGTARASVTHPDGARTAFVYGNTRRGDEGLRLRVDRFGPSDPDGTPLETIRQTFSANAGSLGYVSGLGQGAAPLGGAWTDAVIRPRRHRVTERGQLAFEVEVKAFDQRSRPIEVRERHPGSDAPLSSRTAFTEYHDDYDVWVLGQVRRSHVSPAPGSSGGDDPYLIRETEYDNQALPGTRWFMGAEHSTLSWRSDGTLSSVSDALGRTVSLSNWYRGVPREIQFPGGTSSEAVVSPWGEITQRTSEMGQVYKYAYDAMGRLVRIDYPEDPDNDWTHTQISLTRSFTSEYGLPTNHWQRRVTTGPHQQITYLDARFRPLLTVDRDTRDSAATSSYIASGFDYENRTVFTSEVQRTAPNWSSSQHVWNTNSIGHFTEYDGLGRVVSQTQKTSNDDSLASLTQYHQDGFAKTVTDPNGNQVTVHLQGFGDPDAGSPWRIEAEEGQLTEIVRDVFGKPLTITRSGSYSGGSVSATRAFHYDPQQRLCARVDPESGATVFDYDAVGNISWQAHGQSASGCDRQSVSSLDKTHLEYDARNRITSVVYPGDAEAVDYSYEADGAISSINSGVSSWEYEYNSRRLLVRESSHHPSYGTHSFQYKYDDIGNLVAERYPRGLILEHQPNALGQPSRAGDYATDAHFFADGVLAGFQYGNGIVRQIERDARGLPRRLSDESANGMVQDLVYSYDRVGNVTNIQDYAEDGRLDRAMVYDGLNRLISASAPNLWGDAEYVYDPLDNLKYASIESGDHSRTFHYDYDPETWHLTGISGGDGEALFDFAYDALGNQLSRTGSGRDQVRNFDGANRLTGIDGVADYEYDGHGRRTRVIRSDGSDTLNIYSNDGVLRQTRSLSSGEAKSYVYLAGTMVAQLEHGLGDLPPPYELDLTAPSISNSNNFSLKWKVLYGEPAAGIDWVSNYRLEMRPSGGSWSTLSTPSATTYSESAPDGLHRYRVSACNNDACGKTASASVWVVGDIDLEAPSHSAGSHTVSWHAVTDASYFELERRGGGGSWRRLISPTADTHSYDDSKLSERDYYYRIRACRSRGCGAWSDVVSTIVTLPPHEVPILSSPSSSSTGTFTVSWTTASNAIRYRLMQRRNSGSWQTVHDGSASSYSTASLNNGTYRYRVQACNIAGCSGLSGTRTVEVLHPPSTPGGLSAPSSVTAGSSFTISWNSVSTANNYRLQRRRNGGSWSTIYNSSGTSTSNTLSTTGTYDYRVRACNSSGCSSYSSIVSTTVASGGGGCDPFFGCLDPQSLPEEPESELQGDEREEGR